MRCSIQWEKGWIFLNISNMSLNIFPKWTFTVFKADIQDNSSGFVPQHAEPPTLSSCTKRQVWLWRWLIIYVFLGEINNSMKLLHHNLSLSICLLDCMSAPLHSQSGIRPFYSLVMHVDLTPSPTSTQLTPHNLFVHRVHEISQWLKDVPVWWWLNLRLALHDNSTCKVKNNVQQRSNTLLNNVLKFEGD